MSAGAILKIGLILRGDGIAKCGRPQQTECAISQIHLNVFYADS